MAPGQWPTVSVVMPIRDEASGLRAAVDAVLAQDYPGELEVVLAVAPSADGSQELADEAAAADSGVRVVANPTGTTSAGLNAAITVARGEVIARVDGHAVLTPGYLRRAVEVLAETGADNVGGVQQAVGQTPFEQSVAAAMTSRFGTGGARFHRGGRPGPVDTVYLGVFRREALERVGGFDETLVRNQDYELNWRLRASGGTVWFDPDLVVRYRPRSSLRGLARQYFEYGQWKREVLRRHPRSLRLRQLAPPVAVVAVLGGALTGVVWRPALAAPAAYLAAVASASGATRPRSLRAAAWLPVVLGTMHLSWGCGFLLGARPARTKVLVSS